jgi:hypothetical protein
MEKQKHVDETKQSEKTLEDDDEEDDDEDGDEDEDDETKCLDESEDEDDDTKCLDDSDDEICDTLSKEKVNLLQKSYFQLIFKILKLSSFLNWLKN